jgi:sulfotransferase family protein
MILERARRRLYRTRAFQKTRQRLGLSAPPLHRPLFLVGTVRSGTTYFARCLADHPQVINAGFELSREWHELAGVEIATPGLPCAHCPPAGPEAVAGRADEVRAGFAHLHLVKGGWNGTRLFNKSPHLWNKLSLVRALFPDAVLLVTSRDLRSTVASTKRLWEKMAADWGVEHYLPADPEACWSCVPPAPAAGLDPARLFPGGDAAVLAGYWLRVYESLEREAGAFRTVLPVRHQAFVSDPLGTLREVERAAGLRPAGYPGLAEIQTDRNQRWRSILDEREGAAVDAFVEAHRERIGRLRLAETSL